MASEMGLKLRGEHIALDALLKATGLVASGGDAKTQIVRGGVTINGQIETGSGRPARGGLDLQTTQRRRSARQPRHHEAVP